MTELGVALQTLGIDFQQAGPYFIVATDCDLPSYRLSVPMDLRAAEGYLVARAFLYGPLSSDVADVVARYSATASGLLPLAKLVLDGPNLLAQTEEPLESDLADQVASVLKRIVAVVRLTVLEAVSLATDAGLRRVLTEVFQNQLSTLEPDDHDAMATLAGSEPVTAIEIALTRRITERNDPVPHLDTTTD
jgi:hypothetical protein